MKSLIVEKTFFLVENFIDFSCLLIMFTVASVENLTVAIQLITSTCVLVLTVFRAYYWFKKGSNEKNKSK